MSFNQTTLEDHLKNEHRMNPFSNYLSEIVYGGNDGIVTTFAVVAGFSGANLGTSSTLSLSFMSVLLFGLANLFADGTAMGLGNFLSIRASQDIYNEAKKKEYQEIIHSKQFEQAETEHILENKGFTPKQAKEMTALLMTNPDFWVDFMMTYELELHNTENDNPLLNGLATFLSFIFFGFIPLIPYLITRNIPDAFLYSILATGIALGALGILRGWVTTTSYLRSITECLLIGGTSAIIAYFVGTLFSR